MENTDPDWKIGAIYLHPAQRLRVRYRNQFAGGVWQSSRASSIPEVRLEAKRTWA